MNKKKIGEKTDSLLETEMIKEAKMIGFLILYIGLKK